MENTITGRIALGNTIIISGRYKMDMPFPETDEVSYMRTCDIYLDQLFVGTPTVIATTHHVNTEAHPTQGNTIPFNISNVDILVEGSTTRIMIAAVSFDARRINYDYWCEYVVMGQIL